MVTTLRPKDGDNAETKGKSDAQQPDSDLRKSRGDDRAAAAHKRQPEGADQFGRVFPDIHDMPPLVAGTPIPIREPYKPGYEAFLNPGRGSLWEFHLNFRRFRRA
jgi:hypothetical protein